MAISPLYLRRLRAIILKARGGIQKNKRTLPHLQRRLAGFEYLVQQSKRESGFSTQKLGGRQRGYTVSGLIRRI